MAPGIASNAALEGRSPMYCALVKHVIFGEWLNNREGDRPQCGLQCMGCSPVKPKSTWQVMYMEGLGFSDGGLGIRGLGCRD